MNHWGIYLMVVEMPTLPAPRCDPSPLHFKEMEKKTKYSRESEPSLLPQE